ncbi:MAG: PD-(D/E)XK nuclease family protein, partial [Candidatus Sumerlaeota bacterium]
MTVHKSKGLEFPVAIISRLGRNIARGGPGPSTLLSQQYGLGIHMTDLERGEKYETPFRKIIQNEQKQREREEELRILYVAMTRARDRLILTAAVEKAEERIEGWQNLGVLDEETLNRAAKPVDWIGPAVVLDPEARVQLKLTGGVDVGGGEFHFAYESTEEQVEQEQRPRPIGEECARAILERVRWRYPHRDLGAQPARLTVSEVKRRLEALEEAGERSERPFRPEPVFDLSAFDEEPGTGAERGRLTHLVLQHLDLLHPVDYFGLSAQMDRMIDRGLMSEEERDRVDIQSIADFFESELGKRVLQNAPGHIRREMHFLMGLRPSEIGLEELAACDDTERLRVQGIIDCLVETDDRLVLIDYKTDRFPVEALDERVRKYRPQMHLYKLALERVYGDLPVDAWLYFLSVGEAVQV